ncbi:MAG: ABC transporter substrate-binding protein, partial [Pseudomonadota bacterium]|nr:ABC transporter substrate-binding protein [Pseudomonadota bacterium]
MTVNKQRRKVVKSVAAGVAATALPLPFISKSGFGSDPIVLGLPIAQSTAGGVADHLDHLQGAILAQEEINAAGGILGRELKLKVVDIDIFSPEGCQTSMLKLVDEKVHAMTTPFTLAPIPTIDATVKYKAPLLWGVTQRNYTDHVAAHPDKYSHCFQTDPSEVHYGYTFPIFLKDMKDRGLWTPNNNGIHIVQEQIAYCQTISRTLQEAIPASEFELAGITDIQFPVQNWEP